MLLENTGAKLENTLGFRWIAVVPEMRSLVKTATVRTYCTDHIFHNRAKKQGMNMAEKKKLGPLHRIAGADASTAEEVLKVASFLVAPEDRTQRKTFETLMPYIYVMRNNKYRWAQITKLLNECGFTLQTSAIRSYYHKMLLTSQDLCQARMQEQILLMAEIRKKTKGADLSAIAGIVVAIMDKQRALATPKVDAVPGLHIE